MTHERVDKPQPLSALLWDLDNVGASTRRLPELADALTAMVEPGAVRVVAAQRTRYRASKELLQARGFEVLSGGTRKSGADRQLFVRGRSLSRRGVRRFLLVSNDGGLERLARFGEIHVVTWNSAWVSVRLAAAAHQVTEVRLEQFLPNESGQGADRQPPASIPFP